MIAKNVTVLLRMGLGNARDVLRLNNDSYPDIGWPQDGYRPLYDAILHFDKRFTRFIGSKHFPLMPIWRWPTKYNVTVHPLSGWAFAETRQLDLVSAPERSGGQVFGSRVLYVADLSPTRPQLSRRSRNGYQINLSALRRMLIFDPPLC